MKRWKLFAGLGLALAAIGGASYIGYRTSLAQTSPAPEAPATVAVERGDVVFSVSGPGHAVDSGETTLQAGVSGPIEQILVRPGDAVNAGQLLVVLGERAHFEAAASQARVKLVQAQNALATQQSGLPLAQARLTLTQAQAAYDQAKTERESKSYARTTQETLDIARANYIIAQNGVNDAEASYEGVKDRDQNDTLRAELLSQLAAARQVRDRALGNLNWLTIKPNQKEVAAADAKLALAAAQLEEAQRAYDQILNGAGPDLALAAAQLSEAADQAAAAEADLKSLEVTAPFDGTVTDVKVSTGETVSAGSPLIVLTDPKTLEAEVTVVEEDLPLVQRGQAAKLFFDALPQATVGGVIARIVPKRVEGDQTLYPVYITLPQIPAALVAGMTVDAQIIIQQKTGVLRLPRTAGRARGEGKAEVQVWTGLMVEKRTIQVGLRGDSYIEVISGLKEGELVVSN
jgi:RND family efflux transporter MFP subunit